MTQEKKVQTAAVMDVTGVERAAQDAVRAARTMAEGIAREGEKAGRGIEAMGEGAEKADRRTDAAFKSLSDRLRRMTQQAQRELAGLAASSTGGPGSAGAFEYEASLRGVDTAKLQPQIAVLRELQTQAASLSASMQQAMVGQEFVSGLNQRISALQRQSAALKLSEADMLALRAAELGVAQQADPLIVKLRETAAAMGQMQAAARQAAAADNFLSGLSAQAGALGKTRADLLELKAAQMGVATQAAPMIAAIRAADGELMGMGKNAKATAWAMRLVPAQMTDIVTSLQAGQNPMTVFIQQGGQLKDMFGGVGPAARAFGSYLMALVNPFSVAAAAVGVLGAAYLVGASEEATFRRGVILSGQQAGVTAGQLTDMARAIKDIGGGTQGRAAELLAELAGSADVGRENLQRFVLAAMQLEKVGGPSADKTAEAFRSLAKEPLQAALKLNEGTNFLTRSIYEQIRALELQGKTVEAAKVAQEAYAAAIESRTPQLLGTLGYVERAWNAIKSATKGAVDAALSIGRADTLSQQLDAVGKKIATTRQRIADAGNSDVKQAGLSILDRELKALQGQQGLLQEQARLEQRGADAAAARLAAVKAGAEWDKETDKYLTKQVQMAREVAKVEQLGLAAGVSRVEIERQIAAVREKFADKSSASAPQKYKAEEDAAKAYMKALDKLQDMERSGAASAEELTKTQAKLRDIQADPAWATYSRQQREQIITQAAATQAAEDHATSLREVAKIAGEAGREYEKWLNAMERSVDAVTKQVQALQDEERAALIASAGRMSLKAAIEEVTIARLRDQQVASMGNPDAVAALQREIEARQKLRDLIEGKEQRKAAEDAAKEWAKAAEKIGDSITDSLMRGFDKGKGFAESLRDTVVNMFKTMVLRPVIQAIVQPVAGQIASSIGGFLGGGAQGSIVGQAANAYQLFGAGAGIFGTSAAYGAALGTTSIGAGSQAAMLASQTGVFGAEGAALTAAAAGNTATASALSTLGAAAPYLAAALAVAALAKSLDNSGTLHTGAASSYSAAGGLKSGLDLPGLGFGNLPAYSAETAGLTGGLAKSITSLLDSTATAFGKQAGYSAAAGFADDTSRDGSWGALLIGRMGQTLTNWEATRQSRWAPREFADGQAGLQQYLTAVSKDVRSALDGIGLPTWATEMLDSIGGSPTIDELATVVAQVGAVQQALVGLGYSMPQLATLTGAAVNALVMGFGGAQAMMQSAASYVGAFYSDAERTAIGIKQLRSELVKLGVDDLPATRDAYRKLIESQDLTTESGRQLFAGLVNLSPAFAEVTKAIEQADKAIQTEIDRLRGAQTSTASQAELQARFAVATAQARAGDAKAREALPALSQAMESAAQQTATSAADVSRVRAWLANSLAETIGAAGAGAAPSSFIGEPGAAPSAADTQTARQLAVLSDRIGLLEEPMRASALSAARTARLLERVMPEGDALTVRVAS